MGFFHVVKIKAECPYCKNNVSLNIQIKYGIRWMYTYNIGDEIIWGENNFGYKTDKRVLVSGISEGCPICKQDADYVVEVEHNKIQKVYIDQIGLALEYDGYIVTDD